MSATKDFYHEEICRGLEQAHQEQQEAAYQREQFRIADAEASIYQDHLQAIEDLFEANPIINIAELEKTYMAAFKKYAALEKAYNFSIHNLSNESDKELLAAIKASYIDANSTYLRVQTEYKKAKKRPLTSWYHQGRSFGIPVARNY